MHNCSNFPMEMLSMLPANSVSYNVRTGIGCGSLVRTAHRIGHSMFFSFCWQVGKQLASADSLPAFRSLRGKIYVCTGYQPLSRLSQLGTRTQTMPTWCVKM